MSDGLRIKVESTHSPVQIVSYAMLPAGPDRSRSEISKRNGKCRGSAKKKKIGAKERVRDGKKRVLSALLTT
jgi:hypothetical protein